MNLTKNVRTVKSWLGACRAQQSIQIHPAVQIYGWVGLALATHIVQDSVLVAMAGLSIFLALRENSVRFINLLSRTRWILFSVFLIYAYATPGESLWLHLGLFSPVANGMYAGMNQLFRLLTVLAGLSILLSRLSQQQLINGLYSLLFPLLLFGLSRERVAVRLALTLTYAEGVMQDKMGNWRDRIEHFMIPVEVVPGSFDLHLAQYTSRDWLLVTAVSAALLGAWL